MAMINKLKLENILLPRARHQNDLEAQAHPRECLQYSSQFQDQVLSGIQLIHDPYDNMA